MTVYFISDVLLRTFSVFDKNTVLLWFFCSSWTCITIMMQNFCKPVTAPIIVECWLHALVAHYLDENVFLEQKAIQDRELGKSPDYHYLSRVQRYSEGVRKASRFISFVRDKTLDGRIDTYYFGKSVDIYCFAFILLLTVYSVHYLCMVSCWSIMIRHNLNFKF